MTPDDLRAAMRERTVPEHRPGFWDDLAEELESKAPSSRRWSGWQVAVSAAAAVIVVAGVATLLIRQASIEPVDIGPVATIVPQG